MLAGFQLLVELTRFPLSVCSLSISSMKRKKILISVWLCKLHIILWFLAFDQEDTIIPFLNVDVCIF
jgi:hypothetical protein